MEKWFFSDNGKVTAPLDLDAAKAYLADNPNVYGWHPSFSQWKPVNCILEFADVVPAAEQSLLVPKELTEKFLAKKQRLETKLTSIDDSINHTQSSLNKFERQIEEYKELTKNLNDDVKGAIENIEKKHISLTKKLSQVKNAVSIAEVEINDAITGFDQRINSNDVFMPSCHQTGQSVPSTNQTLSDDAQRSKAKLAQEKLATPHKRVEPVESKVQSSPVEMNEPEKPAKKKVAKKAEKPAAQTQLYETYEANHASKEGFNSMKNMMKSVFKGDKKVEHKVEEKAPESKAAKDEPLSMAERLKLAQNNG